MAAFVITSDTDSVTLDIDGKKASFGPGNIIPYTPDGSGNDVYLYDTQGIFTPSRDRIKIDISGDTVDVDGATVFADADALLTALQAVFFLGDRELILTSTASQDINAGTTTIIGWDATPVKTTPELTFDGTDTITVNKDGFIDFEFNLAATASVASVLEQWIFLSKSPIGSSFNSGITINKSDGAAGDAVTFTYSTRIRIAVSENDTLKLASLRVGAAGAFNTIAAPTSNLMQLRVNFYSKQ